MVRTEMQQVYQQTGTELGKWESIKTRLNPSATGQHDFEHSSLSADMYRINVLQTQFNQIVGVEDGAKEDGVIRAYNPVLARWKFEQLKTPEEVEQFKKYEKLQLEKTLRERYRVATSVVRYSFDNEGKLRNELFPDEQFVDMLKRGIEYRKQNGSNEQEREQKELEGFEYLQEVMSDQSTAAGTKLILISPPGRLKDSPYKDNFVDIFELRMDEVTKKRYVHLTRFKSSLSYEKYLYKAAKLDPHYLDDYRGTIDAWYLSHLIRIDDPKKSVDDIFDETFERDPRAMKEEQFQTVIWRNAEEFADFYVGAICKTGYDPMLIAKSFTAILAKGDEALSDKQKPQKRYADTDGVRGYVQEREEHVVYRDIYREVERLHEKGAETRVGGCGASAGFKIKGLGTGIIETLSNSVAQFGLKNPLQEDESTCKHCLEENSDNHYHCPGCNRKYGNETQKSQGQRTKECGCGFQFGC